MNQIEDKKLEVYGRNELNRLTIIELNNILPQLNKYLDKKIVTNRTLKKSFKYVLNKPNPNPYEDGFARLHYCYLTISSDRLYLNLSICLDGENKTCYCKHFHTEHMVGIVENQVLTTIFSFESIVDDYKLENIIDLVDEEKKIEKCKELEKELTKLKRLIRINWVKQESGLSKEI